MKNIFVGTSGFSYKGWSKIFYPEDLPQKKQLEYYAQAYNSVEINNSFYRLPNQSTYAGWRERTPDNFRFAIKGSRYITQTLALTGTGEAVKNYFDRAQALGDKLGVVLWQLPPHLRCDTAKLRDFAQVLRTNPVAGQIRQAFEFRHHSWFTGEVYDILRDFNFGFCIAHSQAWPSAEEVTADFIYLRFHGAPQLYASNYTDAELKMWAAKARQWAGDKDIYAYFNNDVNGYAVANAQKFCQMLR